MPWNGQGGGGGGPWGGSGGPGPWGRGPGNKGNGGQPPNLDELLRRAQDRLRGLMPGGGGGGGGRLAALAVVVLLLLLWLATGIYRVNPDEAGVVLRFGAYSETTPPGLHFHLPVPIESVEKPKVTRINQFDIGAGNGGDASRRGKAQELLMLTGDKNIVAVNFYVQWIIADPRAYLFNVRDPETTVKAAAEAAVREVVGQAPIAGLLTGGKDQAAADAKLLLQRILDGYDSGIKLVKVNLLNMSAPQPVADAYLDVQNARTDQTRLTNEAEAYSNSIVPVARGEAEQKLQNAEAYRQEIVARAQGDAQRFLSVLNAYQANKEVTAERMYLETMEDVLKNANKVLIDKSAEGVVPYLPLPALAGKPPASPPPSGTSGVLPAPQPKAGGKP